MKVKKYTIEFTSEEVRSIIDTYEKFHGCREIYEQDVLSICRGLMDNFDETFYETVIDGWRDRLWSVRHEEV